MKEQQNLEWKEFWRDEYLRWICGFANAEGGTLVIGKRDDGSVIGVPNAQKLLVDLPNKIRDLLGIVAEVNLKIDEGKELLEIKVEAYPNPISFKGEMRVCKGLRLFPSPKKRYVRLYLMQLFTKIIPVVYQLK